MAVQGTNKENEVSEQVALTKHFREPLPDSLVVLGGQQAAELGPEEHVELLDASAGHLQVLLLDAEV